MNVFGDGISWDYHVQQIIDEHNQKGTPIYYVDSKPLLEQSVEHIKTDTEVSKRKALDAGCHMGRWVDVIQKLGFEYTGADQSTPALEFARKNRPNVRFHQSMLWELPFENEFDFAICNAVLQHNKLEEQDKIVPRVFAALKSGGVFFFAESTLRENTATQRTHEGWVALAESAGFKFVKSFHVNELGLEDQYIFIKP